MSILRSAWKPLAGISIGASAYLYYTRTQQETFTLGVRTKGADGQPEMSFRTLPLLPMKALEARIRQHATFTSNARPEGLVWNYTTAHLASNDPIEDANAHALIQRDEADPSAPGDWLFFAVMDGHGGYHTSQLLSKVLINAVALELNNLIEGSSSNMPSSGLMESVKSLVRQPSTPLSGPLDANPTHVSIAIRDAFTKLDQELLNAPLRVLANNLDEEARKNKVIPDLSQHPLALTTMLPAVSGSCAIMAVFDTAHRDLYVACTGDSRAVAGIWEQNSHGEGKWRVEVLSEDQTGQNPSELKRIQSEHPQEEANDVIRAGRILGGLEPSRAFGDARYKWPRAIQETLNEAFMVGNGKPLRSPPSLFKTPPYVTATPVVTHRKLSLPPLDSGSESTTSSLRFVVLATDGLWDELSSEEVVSLVGGHLAGLRGTIPKSELPNLVRTASGAPTIEGKDKTRRKGPEGAWAFVDDNVSAHLIRNAFGGGDEAALRRVLSIPAPYSRKYRDDVTVTVVWWEDASSEAARTITLNTTDGLKAKL